MPPPKTVVSQSRRQTRIDSREVDADGPRRRKPAAQAKSNTGLFIGIGAGVLVFILILIIANSGGEAPKVQQQQAAQPQKNSNPRAPARWQQVRSDWPAIMQAINQADLEAEKEYEARKKPETGADLEQRQARMANDSLRQSIEYNSRAKIRSQYKLSDADLNRVISECTRAGIR